MDINKFSPSGMNFSNVSSNSSNISKDAPGLADLPFLQEQSGQEQVSNERSSDFAFVSQEAKEEQEFDDKPYLIDKKAEDGRIASILKTIKSPSKKNASSIKSKASRARKAGATLESDDAQQGQLNERLRSEVKAKDPLFGDKMQALMKVTVLEELDKKTGRDKERKKQSDLMSKPLNDANKKLGLSYASNKLGGKSSNKTGVQDADSLKSNLVRTPPAKSPDKLSVKKNDESGKAKVKDESTRQADAKNESAENAKTAQTIAKQAQEQQNAMQEQKEQVDEQKQEKQKDIIQDQKDIQLDKAEIKKDEAIIQKDKQTIMRDKAKIATDKKVIQTDQQKIQQLQAQVAQLTGQIQATSVQIQTTRAAAQSMHATAKSLMACVYTAPAGAALEAQACALDAQAQALEMQKQQLEMQKQQREAEKKQWEQKLRQDQQTLKKDEQKLKQDEQTLKKDEKKLEQDKQKLEKDVEKLKKDVEEFKELKKQSDELAEGIKKMQETQMEAQRNAGEHQANMNTAQTNENALKEVMKKLGGNSEGTGESAASPDESAEAVPGIKNEKENKGNALGKKNANPLQNLQIGKKSVKGLKSGLRGDQKSPFGTATDNKENKRENFDPAQAGVTNANNEVSKAGNLQNINAGVSAAAANQVAEPQPATAISQMAESQVAQAAQPVQAAQAAQSAQNPASGGVLAIGAGAMGAAEAANITPSVSPGMFNGNAAAGVDPLQALTGQKSQQGAKGNLSKNPLAQALLNKNDDKKAQAGQQQNAGLYQPMGLNVGRANMPSNRQPNIEEGEEEINVTLGQFVDPSNLSSQRSSGISRIEDTQSSSQMQSEDKKQNIINPNQQKKVGVKSPFNAQNGFSQGFPQSFQEKQAQSALSMNALFDNQISGFTSGADYTV